MAKPTLENIVTSQTFQNWFDKSNEMVDLFKTDVITASAGAGDTTSGNATLIGSFTGTNLIASTLISTNNIGARSGAIINFDDPILVTSSDEIVSTFLYAGTGGQVRFTDGSISWDVGMDSDGNNNFVIDTGTAPEKFKLTPAGTMTVQNAVVVDNLTVGSLTIGAGGSGLNSDNISEGSTNLYFTNARARAALSGGDGIDISAAGVISFSGEGELDTYQGNKFIATGTVASGDEAYMSGKQISGAPFGVLNATTNGVNTESFYWSSAGAGVTGDMRVTENIQTSGGIIYVKTGNTIKASIDQNGNGYFTGDVTTFGSASDERLKENITPLRDSLEKTCQLNGYVFNYKDRPEDTVAGVIAQEVENVLPEAVYNIELGDETYKAVRYQQLVPLLIEAIKELTNKVNVLENRINN